MSSLKTRASSTELLASVAFEASDILLNVAIANSNGLVGEIATRLRFIGSEVSEQEPHQFPPEIQNLSSRALRDLVEICSVSQTSELCGIGIMGLTGQWPTGTNSQRAFHLTKSAQELHKFLVQTLNPRNSEDRVKSIASFCKQRPDSIKPFQSRFIQLSDSLNEIVQSSLDIDIDRAVYANTNPPARDVYPDAVNTLLLDGVKSNASCVPTYHIKTAHKSATESSLHPTMLCLSSGYRSQSHVALFKTITATSEMAYWQEMAISVLIRDSEQQGTTKPEFDETKALDLSKSSLLDCGAICMRLEDPNYVRILLDMDQDYKLYQRPDPEALQHIISGCGISLSELLRQSELTVEQKIKLSYAVTRAFWLFYNSDMMKSRWTSDDILFIPADKDYSQVEGVPLRAFVSFPFGSHHKASPAEYYDKDQYAHRYPRILFLGIVLLEIGLGYPLELKYNPNLTLVGYTNTAHFKAKSKLKELKEAKWADFSYKDYYIDAIGNCLDSTKFKDAPKHRKSRRRGEPEDADKKTAASTLRHRRDALYRKVVAPLQWLATVGFEDWTEVPLAPPLKKVRRESTFADRAESRAFWSALREQSSFHSREPSSNGDFMRDLQYIAGHIKRCRRHANITQSIRVAILDTGCKKDLPFFQMSERLGRLKRWVDLTAAASEAEVDDYGHGTFMARLLMHVAPVVDLYVIRVAKNTDELDTNKETIAKAIEHAGLDPEWRVDVISMSFGFPDRDDEASSYSVISDATAKVKKDRNDAVIFLASAGNSWERRKDFPASHGDVIAIYAADSRGQFLFSNPIQVGEARQRLGTYGADIPPSIIEEVHEYFPGADLSAGTSIATAIAAGIVAMTLSYIAALPSLLSIPNTRVEQLCASLYTKKGMKQMLYAMSLTRGNEERFINPIWFWGQRKDDMDVFVSVCYAIETMSKNR